MATVKITMTKDYQGLFKGVDYELDSNAAEYLVKQQVAKPFVLQVKVEPHTTAKKTVKKTAKKKAK